MFTVVQQVLTWQVQFLCLVPLCSMFVVAFGQAEFIILNVKMKSLSCTKSSDVSLLAGCWYFSSLISWPLGRRRRRRLRTTKKNKNTNRMWECFVCDRTAYRQKPDSISKCYVSRTLGGTTILLLGHAFFFIYLNTLILKIISFIKRCVRRVELNFYLPLSQVIRTW